MKSATENPTRNANARTVLWVRPLSRIRNTMADPRLAMISTNAITMMIFKSGLRQKKPRIVGVEGLNA